LTLRALLLICVMPAVCLAQEQPALAPQSVEAPSAPNAAVKLMYERRAASARRLSTGFLVAGAVLFAGGLISGELLSHSDRNSFDTGVPFAVEATVLGFPMILVGLVGLAGAAELDKRGRGLDANAETLRSTLLDEDRPPVAHPGRLLALGLGLGLPFVAGGAVVIAVRQPGQPAWVSSGAAMLSFGLLAAGGIAFLANEARLTRDRLDRGLIDDLDVVSVAPFFLRGGGGVGVAFRL
jgi:hypothetical protein